MLTIIRPETLPRLELNEPACLACLRWRGAPTVAEVERVHRFRLAEGHVPTWEPCRRCSEPTPYRWEVEHRPGRRLRASDLCGVYYDGDRDSVELFDDTPLPWHLAGAQREAEARFRAPFSFDGGNDEFEADRSE